jgi:hypothetical protein
MKKLISLNVQVTHQTIFLGGEAAASQVHIPHTNL